MDGADDVPLDSKVRCKKWGTQQSQNFIDLLIHVASIKIAYGKKANLDWIV